jgi:hypothetical protein
MGNGEGAGVPGFIRALMALAIFGLGFYVALKPSVVYTSATPEVVLYFLISLLPAILFGTEATTRFNLRLPGFCFVTGGALAACLGTLFVLSYLSKQSDLSKPHEKIGLYHIKDHEGTDVSLDDDSIDSRVKHYVDGNVLILVFPDRLGEVDMAVKQSHNGPSYRGKVRYASESDLLLDGGLQLKQGGIQENGK